MLVAILLKTSIFHVNNNSLTGPLIIGAFEKRAPGHYYGTVCFAPGEKNPLYNYMETNGHPINTDTPYGSLGVRTHQRGLTVTSRHYEINFFNVLRLTTC